MNIHIESHSFASIEVYKCTYDLGRQNSGPVVCRDCKNGIGAGLGIHRRSYRRSGYLCFACFAKDLTILTKGIDGRDAGFFIDTLGRLRACSFRFPDYSTPDIINLVYIALLEEAHTSIDILLPVDEAAHVWEILDAAEAAIGSNS